VSTEAVLHGKMQALIDKINDPDAGDACVSVTQLTKYFEAAEQIKMRFKPDHYASDAAWRKASGYQHCGLCIKRWRIPDQVRDTRAGTHCHECHTHGRHLDGCKIGSRNAAREEEAEETKMFGLRATLNQYHVVGTKTGEDVPLSWITVMIDICREHGVECHFAPERGDQDGNLHFHLVIRIRCNVADKAEFLAHCKAKCGIIGSSAGVKWSIQHLPGKKGEEDGGREEGGGKGGKGWGGVCCFPVVYLAVKTATLMPSPNRPPLRRLGAGSAVHLQAGEDCAL